LGATSMPTAVFYNAEDNSRAYGRAALAAYVDGHEGRLMRSIKSILGSDLMDEATELPNGMFEGLELNRGLAIELCGEGRKLQ